MFFTTFTCAGAEKTAKISRKPNVTKFFKIILEKKLFLVNSLVISYYL